MTSSSHHLYYTDRLNNTRIFYIIKENDDIYFKLKDLRECFTFKNSKVRPYIRHSRTFDLYEPTGVNCNLINERGLNYILNNSLCEEKRLQAMFTIVYVFEQNLFLLT